MHNLKILVVEDDPVTRTLLERKLTNDDYEVSTAENGAAAVDLLSNQYFDVVLTDLMMPGGIDGIGVLESAKSRYSHTEVILVTAYASVDNAVEAMKKGAADYLQKPINCEELILRLEKISNLKKLAKAAGDLREAMDVTERNASLTIQDLEMTVSKLKNKLADIKQVLSKSGMDDSERVMSAQDMLSRV
ncbi:MAG: response regulator, partial [Thermodesulfobacteriota bacterium]|nr:response regulator [Thermodesulfobacteriota bacterium]